MQIVITGVMALALQAGLGSTATTTRPPLGEVDVLGLVATGVCSSRVAELVGQRGIAFTPKPAYVELLRTAGAQQELLEAIRVAEVHQVEPGTHGPAAPDDATALEPLNAFAQAVQTKLDPKPAEQALIAAFKVQSGDGFSRFVVATVLSRLGQHQESIAQLRQAVRLEPDFADAHERLGSALADDKDWEGAIAELQAALRLDPNAADIHRRLASALLQKGDRGSARSQEEVAQRLPSRHCGVTRIRVSGNTLSGRRVYGSEPPYPEQAKEAKVQGRVILRILIGRDGAVTDIAVLSGDPLLANAAQNAVFQWRYKPVTLNGEPVLVESQVAINFP